MVIREGMNWPPNNHLSYKAAEHSAWYSGDPEILANFYTMNVNLNGAPYALNKEPFWGRQIVNQGEINLHIPIAGDIAETSSNLLFSESPMIKILQAREKNAKDSYKKSQKSLDKMLDSNGFFNKILEGAETCAAIGGVYIKIAWDRELLDYPIPVIVQSDYAIPEFKFGILTAVNFWQEVKSDESGSKVFRLIERYSKGSISYKLYLGTSDKLGKEVNLNYLEETKGYKDISTHIDQVLAIYVPNMLPNRLDRSSSLGRSDLNGIEGLMDSLDETFTCWLKDIVYAQAKILLPESYIQKMNGKSKYNIDKNIFVELDVDPVSLNGSNIITPQQFDIRAEKFEKTALNLIERIITSAGYSPQSFGLNISGRAESGTALHMRERKSFATKSKKENYWQPQLKKLLSMMILVYRQHLGGNDIEIDSEINVAFNDSIINNISELATSVKMLEDASAISIETKVRMVHPDWDEKQIEMEISRIKEEKGIGPMADPDLLGLLNKGKGV